MIEYSQVLEISARELRVRNNLDLSIANLGDLDSISEVSDTAINLDLVLKELLEGGDVEDLVACRLRSIDDELWFESAQLYLDFPILLHLDIMQWR
jgi:hypothetical protein